MTAQDLINRLNNELYNEAFCYRKGLVKGIVEYRARIETTLNELHALGYDKLECIEACGEFDRTPER